MLERPDLQNQRVIACLQKNYGLDVAQLAFLPLGADPNTAVYRVAAGDGTPYFLKLRSGVFDELSVAKHRPVRERWRIIVTSGSSSTMHQEPAI